MQNRCIHIILRSTARALGLKRYFTAMPCVNGHIAERYIKGTCIGCHQATDKMQWHRENRERSVQNSRDWHANNKDRDRDYREKYRKENPEVMRHHERNRRARINSAEGSHSFSDIELMLVKQKEKCAFCQSRLIKSGDKKYHIDHIMPLSKGGSNWPGNLQLLCKKCNLSKHAKDPFEFAKENGRLL